MALIGGVALALVATAAMPTTAPDALGHPSAAQPAVRGVVLSREGALPVAAATVTALGTRATATTDDLGRFVIAVRFMPESLTVAAVGWQPDTVVITRPTDALSILLDRAPVIVSDLIAVAPAVRSFDLTGPTRWHMPMDAARAVPPAVETDVYRALALIPAVSFTSPLSARPLIRGYDAQEVTTRIDGFEVLNLYHLGRAFSSFPADAAEHLAVTPAPYTSAHGGSIAGIVDITGRSGQPGDLRFGGGTSFGSFGAWAGGGNRSVRGFVAGRLLHLKVADLIPGLSFPYHFEDLYGTAVLGPVERPVGRVTLFATQDDVGDEESGLRWSNVVAGSRWRLVSRNEVTIEASTAFARFSELGVQVPNLHRGAADFRNLFRRASASLHMRVTTQRWWLATGMNAGWRRIENHVAAHGPSDPGTLSNADTRVSQAEFQGYVDGAGHVGPVTIELGFRAEAAGQTWVVDPRLHLRLWVDGPLTLGLGIGRASRLYHTIADARSEPDLESLDFWLKPGDGIPTPRVDHGTLDLAISAEPVIARISAFASRGRGIGELRPESDQRLSRFEFFRFGRSRTRGVEAQAAVRGGPGRRQSFSIAYVYSHSDRDFGHGWTRWAQDRRHQVRMFGQAAWGKLRLFAAVDLASGVPLTPQIATVRRLLPGGEPVGFPIFPEETAVYGPENSAATAGTFRTDAGLAFTFGGPDGERFSMGLSIINLLGGAVAPIASRGQGTQARDQAGRPTAYRRLFDLPPIPTLTLRAAF